MRSDSFPFDYELNRIPFLVHIIERNTATPIISLPIRKDAKTSFSGLAYGECVNWEKSHPLSKRQTFLGMMSHLRAPQNPSIR